LPLRRRCSLYRTAPRGGSASVLVLCHGSARAWSANDILVAREVTLQLQQAIARMNWP